MHVLVTGGTGFVGSHAVRALLDRGHRVRVLARNQTKVERVFGDSALPATMVGDATDPTAVSAALEGVDAVVHCAGLVATEARRATEIHDTNVRLVEVVVGGAADRGIGTIVYISSVLALFAPGSPIDEHSALSAARSPYAESKVASEEFVKSLRGQGAQICTLYPPAIIGPEDPGLSEANHAIRSFVSQLMFNTSSGVEALDVRDMAALITAFVTSGQSGRHVVSGRYLSWPDAIALVEDLTGRPVKSLHVNGALLRVLGRVGDLINNVVSFDFPLSSEAMRYMTQWPGTTASPAIDAAGITLRDSRHTYADTIRWLYRVDHISRDQAGNLAD